MFIVYGLPRSRTFWLSQFLTYKDWQCGHDEIRYVRDMNDIRSYFKQANIGTVETAASPFYRLVQHYVPNIKTVIVRRDPIDILRSLSQLNTPCNFEATEKMLRNQEIKFYQIEKNVPNVLSVNFEELNDEATCAKIFEHCLPFKHDPVWYNSIKDINLQVHYGRQVEYCKHYMPQLQKAAKIAKMQILSLLQKPEVNLDGIEIKEEPFQTWVDEQRLVKSHLAFVGENPDVLETVNFEVFRMLEKEGCLQTTIARCNGKVFGYLITTITPWLMESNEVIAQHTTFYASPEFKGLGKQIMREANQLLADKGIKRVQIRTGIHESAPAIKAIAQRLGAKEFGELFMLNIEQV